MQAVKKNGVPRGAIPVVLMRNLAVRYTYTMIIYVGGGKLEGSEISEKSSEKEVELLQAVKKDGVTRGAIPVLLTCNWAVGNTYTIRIYDKQSNRQITEENSSGTILKHVRSVESVLCDKHKFSSYVSN